MMLIDCQRYGLRIFFKEAPDRIVGEEFNEHTNGWRYLTEYSSMSQVRKSYTMDCDTIIHDDGEE